MLHAIRSSLRAAMVVCLVVGIAQAQVDEATDVVVRIGDTETISKVEFERAVTAIRQARMLQARQRGINDPRLAGGVPISHEEKLKVLDAMVNSKILYMLAQEAGVQVADEEVNEEIDKNKAALPPNMTFEDFMKRQGITMDEIRELTRMRLASRKFSAGKTQDVTVSDEEVSAEYERYKTRGFLDTVDISHILVRVQGDDPAAWEAGKQRIDGINERLKNGEDFGLVAKETSDDDRTKNDGGVLKGVTRGMMGSEFDDRMFTMPIGEVTAPFKSRAGWHLMKVLARGTAALEGGMKERLHNALLRRKQQEVIDKLVSDARSKMSIQISLPPEEPTPTAPPAADESLIDKAV